MRLFKKQCIKRTLFSVSLILSMSSLSSLSLADEGQRGEKLASDWRITTGLGVYIFPEYDGADEHRVLPIPLIDVKYKERVYFNLFDGIGAEVVKTENFTLKGGVGFEFGREESDHENLAGTGDIDDGGKFKVTAEYEIGSFTPYASVQKYLGGTDGLQAEIGVETMFRFGDSYTSPMLMLNVAAEYSDEKHMLGFFGIDEGQSTNSGLAIYTPDAGISAYTVGATYIHPLAGRWATTANLNFTTLTGDAADSPLVLEENQISGGIFVTYTF